MPPTRRFKKGDTALWGTPSSGQLIEIVKPCSYRPDCQTGEKAAGYVVKMGGIDITSTVLAEHVLPPVTAEEVEDLLYRVRVQGSTDSMYHSFEQATWQHFAIALDHLAHFLRARERVVFTSEGGIAQNGEEVADDGV